MRTAIGLALTVLVPGWVIATPLEKLYYAGEVKVSSAEGKAIGS